MDTVYLENCASNDELNTIYDDFIKIYIAKVGGIPPNYNSSPKSPNIVFTINEHLDERCSQVEYEEDSEEDFEDNGVVVDNTRLRDFMVQYFPDVLDKLCDGDIIRISKDSYRNDSTYIMYNSKITFLITEDGFHDYGLPLKQVRKWFLNDWYEYGFANNYPEYETKEANENMIEKQCLNDIKY